MLERVVFSWVGPVAQHGGRSSARATKRMLKRGTMAMAEILIIGIFAYLCWLIKKLLFG